VLPDEKLNFLSKSKIALSQAKWPDVERFWWPDQNAMGGRFGAFFALNA